MKPEARTILGEKASFRIPGKTLLSAAAVAVVMVAVGTYLAMRHLDGGDHAQIIAHRGGAAGAPKNTIAAFKRGIADGTDWLERTSRRTLTVSW
jgi:glycerophosphoryl diester phosphodiesterase